MIKLRHSGLHQLLPNHLAQQTDVQALGYAIGRQVARLTQWADGVGVYCNLDTMPDSVVDALAVELRVEGYRQDLPLQTKQALVRDALSVTAKLGTAGAVSRVAETIYGFGQVREWYQYGGQPYHFKLYMSALGTPQEKLEEFLEAVERIKNVRSVLESLVFYEVMEVPVYAGVYTQFAMTAITDLTLPRQGDAQAYIGTYTRAADVSITNITV